MSLIKPMDLLLDTVDYYNSGMAKGYSTGWDTVDQHYTVKPGQLTILTGMPSHGKSEWLDALLVNLVLRHQFKIAIFSPENHPLHLHLCKIIEKYVGMRTHGPDRMEVEDLTTGIEWANKHFVFIKPKETEFTPLHICNEAAGYIGQWSTYPKAVVIDPWNEMDHYRTHGLTETEYISRVLTELRRFAREFECHVFLVAHPAKMVKDKDGNYPVPTPYNIAGSAHFYNKADNCLAIYREVVNNPQHVELHVQKVRFRSVGSPGRVDLKYNLNSSQYEEVIYGK